MKTTINGDTLTVANLDELTAAGANQFKSDIEAQLTSEIRHLRLDCQGMKLMDSTGIGMLIILHKRLSQVDGSTSIIDPSPIVEQLFKMTRLNQVFKIEKT